MIPFSLSVKAEKLFPTQLEAGGVMVDIDPDFRTVLKCLRVLDDPDATDQHKAYLLMRWFFKSAYVPDALAIFSDFVSCGEEDDGEPPVMDFEQDADAIYSSFLSQYGMDLTEVPFLHWRKFHVLMSGLGEDTALQHRISLRELDTSKMKGEEKIKMDRAKRRVALKVKMSTEEKLLQQRLDEALASGNDPTEALAALQAYYKGGE